MRNLTRRELLKMLSLASGALLLPKVTLATQKDKMLLRPIPSTGEMVPVIGLGTWIQFDVGSSD